MKKQILLSSVAFLFYGTTALGQGGNIGNASLPGGFLGFNGVGLSQPLQIRNNFNQPINFFTNGTQRMTILGGPVGGPTTGFVGIGTSTLLSVLSIDGTTPATGEVFRTDCAAGDNTFWRMLRGGNEYGKLWNTATTIPFWSGGIAAGQAYRPRDFILDASRGAFIVQGWSKDLSGTNVLKEIFRTTSGGSMRDYDLSPLAVDGLRIQSQDKKIFSCSYLNFFIVSTHLIYLKRTLQKSLHLLSDICF